MQQVISSASIRVIAKQQPPYAATRGVKRPRSKVRRDVLIEVIWDVRPGQVVQQGANVIDNGDIVLSGGVRKVSHVHGKICHGNLRVLDAHRQV